MTCTLQHHSQYHLQLIVTTVHCHCTLCPAPGRANCWYQTLVCNEHRFNEVLDRSWTSDKSVWQKRPVSSWDLWWRVHYKPNTHCWLGSTQISSGLCLTHTKLFWFCNRKKSSKSFVQQQNQLYLTQTQFSVTKWL